MNIIKTLLAIVFLLFPNPSVAQDHIENPTDDVIVYMNDFPPFAFLNENKIAEGEWVDKVKGFINQTNLSYHIDIIPWQRAYLEATIKDNILIAHIDRTAEREDQFHWLMPITSLNYSLISRKDSKFVGKTLEEIIAGYGTALCSGGTAHCGILKAAGFPESQIIKISTYNSVQFHSLLEANRADFMLEDFESMKLQLAKIGLDNTSITELFPITTVTSYLAVSKSIDPAILEQLQKVQNRGVISE